MSVKMRQRLGAVLRTGYLRNILIVSVCIAVVFPIADRFFIYPLFSAFVIENSEEEAVRAARHLALELSVGPQGVTKESLPPRFIQKADEITRTLGLMKFKVFSKSGETLFSTDPEDIGRINEKAYFHDIVAKGGVYTKFVKKDTKTLEDQIATLDVVETYVPISGDRGFAGAFEIYLDITGRMAKIDRLLFVSSIVLVGVAFGLLIVVSWTLSNAASVTLQRDLAEAALFQAKERAEEAEELFSKAYHSSPVFYTISSSKDARHIEVNDAWSSVTGYSREEAMKKTGLELGIWANPEQRKEFVKQMKNQGFVRNYEMVLRTKLGVEKDMLFSGEFISYRGEDCLLVVGQDITESKEIDRMKNAFISTVSHELRTPLTAIRGSLGMVESGALKDPEKVTQMIRLAASNTERLIILVNDLLDMEKLQSGQMELKMEKSSLTEIVNDSIKTNKPFADEQKVNFKLTETVPDAFVKGDSNRLAQVLANLLSNAAKFSPEGGTVEISLTRREGNYRVTVSDRGPGVPDEFRDQIFDRFTQADATDTRQKGGTGLGLSITKAIVEKHGGAIGFDTEMGVGTMFFFTLPASE